MGPRSSSRCVSTGTESKSSDWHFSRHLRCRCIRYNGERLRPSCPGRSRGGRSRPHALLHLAPTWLGLRLLPGLRWGAMFAALPTPHPPQSPHQALWGPIRETAAVCFPASSPGGRGAWSPAARTPGSPGDPGGRLWGHLGTGPPLGLLGRGGGRGGSLGWARWGGWPVGVGLKVGDRKNPGPSTYDKTQRHWKIYHCFICAHKYPCA